MLVQIEKDLHMNVQHLKLFSYVKNYMLLSAIC